MAEGDQVGGRTSKKCQPCLKKNITRIAVLFCPTCNEFQCDECSKVHGIYAFMTGHVFVTVSEGMIRDQTKPIDLKGIDICQKHKKPFEIYCEDEKVLNCITCAIVDHNHCKKVVIENIAKTDSFDKLKENIQISNRLLHHTVDNIEEAETLLTTNVTDIEDKLSKLRTKLIDTFEQFADKITKQVTSYRDEITKGWNRKKLECETKKEAMHSTEAAINDIVKHGTNSQQFIAANIMADTIQNDMKYVETLFDELKTIHIAIDFNDMVESLKIELVTALNLDEFEIKYTVPRKSTLKHIASTDLKQRDDDVGEPLYSGLDFLADGTVVATDNENGKVVTYDTNLKLLSNFKLPYNHPLCVAAVTDDKVIITGGNCRLDLLQVNQSHTMTLNRTIKVNVKYDSISMMNDNEAVVSTIDHDTPVRTVSMSGEEKDIDIAFPSKKYPLGKSSSAYIRGKHKIVLTDVDENTVIIYDMESGERIVVKHDLINVPYGVAVGPYDHVFVSNIRHIVEMTHTGHVLSSFDVGMYFPSTICISRDKRRLAVSNADPENKMLKIYELSSD